MNFEEYAAYDGLGLADLVKRGEVKASELLDLAIARMESENPKLNAVVIPMIEDARRTLAEGPPKGPFEGVPFLIKDLMLLSKGARTTNGCRFFADQVADHDSELVSRYRRAGLVTLGKSASPEFGLTATTESKLYGATRNPWNLAHSSGGSSGGASAAVASGMVPLANASDGGGSIRIPASCCGLVGLKPSRGRMPFGPDVGEGWSGMSTVHAVSRSVRDTAALLDATDGVDVGAPYGAPPKARPYLEETKLAPGTLRIALLRETFNGAETHPDCRDAVSDAAALCESLGHKVEEARVEIDAEALSQAAQLIMAANLRSTLDDHAAVVGRAFGKEDLEDLTWIMSQAIAQRSADEYARSIRTIHRVGRVVERFFQDYDVILSPTMAAPPVEIGLMSLSNPDLAEFAAVAGRAAGYTQCFNASGHPAISLPLHWSQAGLPIGLQFAARFGDEATLIRLAAQLEEARPWFDRHPPR